MGDCNSCGSADSCGPKDESIDDQKIDSNGGHACGAGPAVNPDETIEKRLLKIKHKIAIMSGKGGVGKSTVTVNLAMALNKKGNKVGILDADITAPNIPLMLGMDVTPPYATPAGVFPAEKDGIKVISMAFLLPDDDTPIIWRGPMIMDAIAQFLSDIVWGDLDYLLIDLPPGTGDETLSIMQLIPEMDGVINVTTPQEVAVLDTRRAMNMAFTMKQSVIGVIENMSGFVCPHCDEVTNIFKEGGGQALADRYKVPLLSKIPIDPRVGEGGDSGTPVINDPDSPVAQAFDQAVEKVERILAEKAVLSGAE